MLLYLTNNNDKLLKMKMYQIFSVRWFNLKPGICGSRVSLGFEMGPMVIPSKQDINHIGSSLQVDTIFLTREEDLEHKSTWKRHCGDRERKMPSVVKNTFAGVLVCLNVLFYFFSYFPFIENTFHILHTDYSICSLYSSQKNIFNKKPPF